ncbi:MAG TPA: DNA recombination protein RmuC [Anaerolineae bacterium]
MADSTLVIIFLSGLLIGGGLGALFMLLRGRRNDEASIAGRAAAEAENRSMREQLAARETELAAVRIETGQLQADKARLQQASLADAEKLRWVEQAQTSMREAFVALSSQLLTENAATFSRSASAQMGDLLKQVQGDWNTQKAQMQGLVDPLQQNLTSLDAHVRELEQKREGAYQRVDLQLNELMQANFTLRDTTTTLAQALKSSSVRGRWGELQLRRIAEISGMNDHIDFEEQVGVEEGRPDMVVRLPNGGSIPIDSKTPMTSYLDAIDARDEGVRKDFMDKHVKAMRGRVSDLGSKKYWQLVDHAADFVVMFVPSEAYLSAAFEVDPTLMEYAFNQKVMVVAPVTLLALLKTVAYGWQQHRINEDAQKIAEEGREFYRRLVKFVNHLSAMRQSLNSTVDNYNKAIGSLDGRLLPSVRKLEAMATSDQPLEAPAMIDLTPRLVPDSLPDA